MSHQSTLFAPPLSAPIPGQSSPSGQPCPASAAAPPPVSGTREWASQSANCVTGCPHDCRYCYARYNACVRFHRVSPAAWPIPRVRTDQLRLRWQRLDGVVMFPTTHDITPDTLDACLYFLANILRPGNRVLIVSKPHLPCVQRLCADLRPAADRVQFRFTIGADDDALLRYWEPGAPPFAERFASLAHAHAAGFRTSVSAEPLLDAPNVQRLVDRLRPHITDTLWIGKLNCPDSRIQSRPGDDPARLAAL
ncbi:MAG TPA: radical SAM protein, partial [Candidatus Brocadiia bacterium]|nr:radical SAM protein [Candidatus Brocadiia bacterium]